MLPIFGRMLLSLKWWENRATKMLHENLNAEHHLMSSLIRMNHWKILSTVRSFQRYLFFGSDGWRTDETYEAEVLAVVEQQYLPTILVPIQHMAFFYRSVAEPDRDVLKLPIRGYMQANSASWRQWRKWIDAIELEWAKAHGGNLHNKWYLLDCIIFCIINGTYWIQFVRHVEKNFVPILWSKA